MKDILFLHKLVELLSKLFLGQNELCHSKKESVEKDDKSRGCWVNGKNYGGHGSWTTRSKRSRHFSIRREVKVVENGRKNEKIEKRKNWLVYISVFFVSGSVYLNSLHGDFVHDDLSAIKGNEDVSGENGIGEIFFNDFWGKPMADPTSHKSYRPLTILTFRLNAWVHGLTPFGFHLVNVCLHGIVCLLFLRLCFHVLRMNEITSLIAGLHFASHPIHTEAVSGIVGRADVLGAFFVLTSFLSYHRCQREGDDRRYIFASVLLALGAMLSKEHGITVLGINFVWDMYLHRNLLYCYLILGEKRSPRGYKLFKRLFIIGVACLSFVCFRLLMLRGSMPQFSDQDNPASFATCRMTRFRTFSYLPAFNFWLLLAPISLSYDWQMGSIPLIQKWMDSRNIVSLLFYGFLVYATLQILSRPKTRRDLALGFAFLVIPFIPASNLLFSVGFVVAERVLYIPSLGLSLLFGVGARRLILRCNSLRIVYLLKVFLLLGLFGVKTLVRNEDWRNRESLFTSGLKLLHENAKMHYNYANLQKDLGNTEKGIHHYREALRLWPHHASANNNLGTLLNDTKNAEVHFHRALRINPLHAHAFYNLANLKRQHGQKYLAIRLMERSLELEADNMDALTNLASMYTEVHSFAEAEKIYLKILKLKPKNPHHLNNYANFLQKIGRSEEALHFYQEALFKEANHTFALLNSQLLMKKLQHNNSSQSLYPREPLHNKLLQMVEDGLRVLYLRIRRPSKSDAILNESTFPRHSDDLILTVHLLAN